MYLYSLVWELRVGFTFMDYIEGVVPAIGMN
jgi:hypothetical protein